MALPPAAANFKSQRGMIPDDRPASTLKAGTDFPCLSDWHEGLSGLPSRDHGEVILQIRTQMSQIRGFALRAWSSWYRWPAVCRQAVCI
jgi:hypothetical protein